MLTRMRLLLGVLVTGVALLFCVNAFADAPAVAHQSALGVLTPYIPIIIPLLASLGVMLRGWTPKDGFFHTTIGHAVITLLGAVCGGGVSFLQKGELTKQALIMAIGGAVAAWFGAFKPTGKDADAGAASGIAAGAKQAAMMGVLVLAFLGLGAPTCSPGAQALGQCELGKLSQTLQTVVATVVQIAVAPSSTVSDLWGAAQKVGPDQFGCAVAAVSAWLGGQIPSHGQANDDVIRADALLHAYMAAHPSKSACRDWPRPIKM